MGIQPGGMKRAEPDPAKSVSPVFQRGGAADSSGGQVTAASLDDVSPDETDSAQKTGYQPFRTG